VDTALPGLNGCVVGAILKRRGCVVGAISSVLASGNPLGRPL